MIGIYSSDRVYILLWCLASVKQGYRGVPITHGLPVYWYGVTLHNQDVECIVAMYIVRG